MPAKIYKILNSCKQNSQFVDTKFSICHYKILKTSLFVVTLTVCTEMKRHPLPLFTDAVPVFNWLPPQ